VAVGVEQRRRLVERAQAGPQGHVTGARADHRDVGERPVIDVAQPLEQRVVRDEDLCSRVADNPFQQGSAVCRVDRDVDRSPQVDPEPGAQQLRPVRQPAQDRVAEPHTEPSQAGGDALRFMQCLRVGPAGPVLEPGEDLVRLQARLALQHRTEDKRLAVLLC
jgi:hypothetical protein